MKDYNNINEVKEDEQKLSNKLNSDLQKYMQCREEKVSASFFEEMKNCKTNLQKFKICSKYLTPGELAMVEIMLRELTWLRAIIIEYEKGLYT